jgi:hypothetical protein
MVTLLRDLEPYGVIFMTTCIYYFTFPVIFHGKATVNIYKKIDHKDSLSSCARYAAALVVLLLLLF